MWISYFEVYNESINDLLANNSNSCTGKIIKDSKWANVVEGVKM